MELSIVLKESFPAYDQVEHQRVAEMIHEDARDVTGPAGQRMTNGSKARSGTDQAVRPKSRGVDVDVTVAALAPRVRSMQHDIDTAALSDSAR